jgi:hypothetical protein
MIDASVWRIPSSRTDPHRRSSNGIPLPARALQRYDCGAGRLIPHRSARRGAGLARCVHRSLPRCALAKRRPGSELFAQQPK